MFFCPRGHPQGFLQPVGTNNVPTLHTVPPTTNQKSNAKARRCRERKGLEDKRAKDISLRWVFIHPYAEKIAIQPLIHIKGLFCASHRCWLYRAGNNNRIAYFCF